jgi:hypothetical protein
MAYNYQAGTAIQVVSNNITMSPGRNQTTSQTYTLIPGTNTNITIQQNNSKLWISGYIQGWGNGGNGATGGEIGTTGNYLSNFRVGNQLSSDDVFEITAGDHGDVNNEWKETPALAIQGTNNRVAINSSVFGGTDPEETDDDGNPIERVYTLNIGGDININGLVFQNNAEFVTSRWTEAPNEIDIYRGTKVGINFQTAKNPDYALDVEGSTNINGTTYRPPTDPEGPSPTNDNVYRMNGEKLFLDTYGVIRCNKSSLSEDITIPANTNAMSIGPLVLGTNTVITISDGAAWSIV